MIQDINLVKSIPNKEIRESIKRGYWGIIPCDGITRSATKLLDNSEQYARIAEKIDKSRNKQK